MLSISSGLGFNTEATVVFGGEDRDLHTWDWTSNNVNFTTAAVISMYDSDHIQVTNMVIINDLDATGAFKVTATHNGWSQLPAGYGGNKTSTGGDVQLMVDNISGMSAYTNYDGTYTQITDSGTDYILKSNSSVNNATADINGRILMDWITDIKGAYAMTFTLTVTSL